jgi:hypothetical protein
MTTFDPSLAALDRPDQLGGALQQGLPRPMNPKLTWSLVRTFFLGGVTGGILPTLILPKRFRDFATAEQLQIWHLAEWLRLQTGDSESVAVTQAAKRIMPGSALRQASIAFVIVAIGIACSALMHDGPLPPKWLALTLPELNLADFHLPSRAQGSSGLPGTSWFFDERHHHGSEFYFYSPPRGDSAQDQWHHIYHPGEQSSGERDSGDQVQGDDDTLSNTAIATDRSPLVSTDLVSAFALAMSGAALCWLIEINTHIARVRRFVVAFNQLSGRYGVGPVRAPGVQLGLRPLWILGAAATCTLGGFWAVPVMLAAAAHRRYIRTTSLRLRSDLARRQRDVLLARRPALRVPASTHLMGTCTRELCRATNPPEAVFCRRCGTKLES